jgi:hypothetical protein
VQPFAPGHLSYQGRNGCGREGRGGKEGKEGEAQNTKCVAGARTASMMKKTCSSPDMSCYSSQLQRRRHVTTPARHVRCRQLQLKKTAVNISKQRHTIDLPAAAHRLLHCQACERWLERVEEGFSGGGGALTNWNECRLFTAHHRTTSNTINIVSMIKPIDFQNHAQFSHVSACAAAHRAHT